MSKVDLVKHTKPEERISKLYFRLRREPKYIEELSISYNVATRKTIQDVINIFENADRSLILKYKTNDIYWKIVDEQYNTIYKPHRLNTETAERLVVQGIRINNEVLYICASDFNILKFLRNIAIAKGNVEVIQQQRKRLSTREAIGIAIGVAGLICMNPILIVGGIMIYDSGKDLTESKSLENKTNHIKIRNNHLLR